MLTSGWSVGKSPLRGDRNYTEAVNQSLQIPSHLKVAVGIPNEEARGMPENLPLSLYMKIPDPILLGDRSDRARSLWGSQLRQNSGSVASILVPASYLATINNPFLAILNNIRARRMLSLAKVSLCTLKDAACGDDVSLVAEDIENPQEDSREGGLAIEGAPEDGAMEIAAIKKQLHKITGRLQVLEAQCNGWRQKELILYSALISACVLNTWLWMRR